MHVSYAISKARAILSVQKLTAHEIFVSLSATFIRGRIL